MYGLIGKFTAADPADADGIWISAGRRDPQSQKASLDFATVQDAIRRARPIIAGMKRIAQTRPAGGHGLLQSA